MNQEFSVVQPRFGKDRGTRQKNCQYSLDPKESKEIPEKKNLKKLHLPH